MKKKVLIYANYFYPEVASLGQLMTEVAENIMNDFSVTVICAVPCYTGKIEEIYKKEMFYFEKYKAVNIIRVRVPEVDKNSKISRVKHILSYFINSIKATYKIKDVDVILTVSQPPVLGGMLGRIGKFIKKSKLIYNIQDFNPEQVEAVSYSKNKIVIKIMRFFDNGSLKKADKILVVGNEQLETLEKRNKSFINKSLVINNWTNEKLIYPLSKFDIEVLDLKKEYGLENKFIIMYSGNIGLFYDIENIIKVMMDFKEYNDLAFVFAGEGAMKNKLKQYREENNICNIHFLPYQPKERLNTSLNIADLHLVINAKGIKGISVPSKLYGVMAAGKPILGILEEGTDARTIIEKAECGYCVEPGEYERISETIKDIYLNKDNLRTFGDNARKYLEVNLSRKVALRKYKELLEQ
jgi:Glycosyltransferase